MSYYAASALINAFTSLALAGFAALRSWRNQVSRWFVLFAVSVGLWSVFYFLWQIEHSSETTALFWTRVLMLGAIWIPTFFIHFVFAFIGALQQVRTKQILRAAYVLSTLYFISDLGPWFVTKVVPRAGFTFWPIPGPAFHPFLAQFIGTVIYAHVLLYRVIHRSPSAVVRNQARYIFLGTLIGYAGGATNFPLWYDIPILPIGNALVSVYIVMVAYAIARYRFMDINVAITRTAVFTIVYALVLGLPLVGALVWQHQLEQLLGIKWWVWLWVVCALLATVAHYTNLYFQAKAEERLLKAQRRYQATLLQASHGMTQIRDLKRLLDMIVHVITKAVGVTHAAAYLEDAKENAYLLRAYRYKNKLGSIDRLSKDDPLLVRWLKDEEEPVVLEELKAKFSDTAAGNGHDNTQTGLLSQLNGLNASVVVPSFMQNELIGFLVLGPKRDGRIFTTEDLNVFSTLANQAALAIENARFFDELKMNEVFMIQSEKMASLGQLASGMAHEIHNPLAIISGESQLYLEQARGKNPQIDTLLQSIIDECFRAADITRRILRFAKPGKAEFQPVDMKAVIEECLQLVAYQVRLDRFQRTINVPADLPKVKGNQNQLQEVILNLVLNACQAMGEQGGKIEIAAKPDGDEVEIRVADNGPGIPKSKQSKVFDPFYTTKATGTGLGLFVSHRIIRAHNGTIRVDSTEGQGTEFTIRLPVFREAEAGAR